MARVCVGWFPKTNGFYMDDRLKLQIDVLLKNIKHDWDFTILITGQGEVRVGKSMLALQIGSYWTYEIEKRFGIKCPFNINQNIVFEGKNLIKKGNELGIKNKYAVLIFDEAGAELEGKKVLSGATQDVLDYYRECGQYNLLNILVMPEFFDFPKGIALTRSIFLLDVSYLADEDAIFQRGYFDFYSKRSKKWLYLKGKKELNYSCVRSDFGTMKGRFYKYYPINEQEYRVAKIEALKKRESKKRNRFQIQRDALIYLMCGEKKEDTDKPLLTQQKLSIRLEQLTGISIDRTTLSDALHRMGVELGDELNDED